MNRKTAFAAVFLVAVASVFIVISELSDESDAAPYRDRMYLTLRTDATIEISSGTDFRFYSANGNESTLSQLVSAIPWVNGTVRNGGDYYGPEVQGTIPNTIYVSGIAVPGTYHFTFGGGMQSNYTFVVTTQITYVIAGSSNVTQTYGSSDVMLHNPGTQPNMELRWYTGQNGTGTHIGNAGQTKTINSSMNLYGRWVQTEVILPPSADVYVHYLGSFTYTVPATPADSIISAQWSGNTNGMPAISVNGLNVSVAVADFPNAGTEYTMKITASKSGMTPKTMNLIVKVYSFEVDESDDYGLGAWSHIVTTVRSVDTMSLIRGMHDNVRMTAQEESRITVNNTGKKIICTFLEDGLYEFALKVTPPVSDPNNNVTIIVRVMVFDHIITGIPSADRLEVIVNPNTGIADLAVVNPSNYASITWSFGDSESYTSGPGSYTAVHNYAPGIYTATATLRNSFQDMHSVSATIGALRVSVPKDAYRGIGYEAMIQVDALSANNLNVVCPDWLDWEFIHTDTSRYVRFEGIFDDMLLISDPDDPSTFANVTVSSSDSVDESWNIIMHPFETDVMTPIIEVREIDGQMLEIRCTERPYANTYRYILWGDTEPISYISGGWVRSPVLPVGDISVTVQAWRGGSTASASETVTIRQMEVSIRSEPRTSSYEGEEWSYTPETNVEGATIYVSGISWLSSDGTTISGIAPAISEQQNFSVIVTASVDGYVSATQTFTLSVFPLDSGGNYEPVSWYFDMKDPGSIPEYVPMTVGDYAEFRYTGQIGPGSSSKPSLLEWIHGSFPELEYVHESTGFAGWFHDHYLRGYVRNGTHSFEFALPSGESWNLHNVTFETFDQITYVRDDGSELRTDRTHDTTVSLPNPGPISDPAFRWAWYSDPGDAATFKGYTGGQYTFSGVQTLYAKQVRTSVSLMPSSADVYVHYLGSFSYSLDSVIPEDSTLNAEWIQWSGDTAPPLPEISGKTISVSKAEMTAGMYLLRVTASKASLLPATITLNVHMYPHEIRDLDTAGLSMWSYTVSTLDDYDTMTLIHASRTSDNVTTPIPDSLVNVDNVRRNIEYGFTEPGVYEFALKISAGNPNANTTMILRIIVSNDIVTQPPSVSGVQVIRNASNNFDLVLSDPSNYVSISWDFGDGITELNQNTTRNHTYAPGFYTVTVTLSNSLGVTVAAAETISAMSPQQPLKAYLNVRYDAVANAASSYESDVTVECPEWMTYRFYQTNDGNFVHIYGTFTDIGLVGSSVNITISSSNVTDKTWTVELCPPEIVSLAPDFEWRDAGGQRIDVRYTGRPADTWTHIYFIWWPGAGDAVYSPDTEGWMNSPVLSPGNVNVTVKAVRSGTAAETVTHRVTIQPDGSSTDPPGGGNGNNNNGTGSGNDDPIEVSAGGGAALYATIGVIVSAGLFLGALVTGRYGIALIAVSILIAATFFGGVFDGIIGNITEGMQ